MSMQAIMFDLDGTLLPMDQEAFTKGYFQELAKVLCPLGMEPQALIAAVWGGTKAMVKNTGEVSNETVFWRYFSNACPLDIAVCRPLCDEFYTTGFHKARKFTGENPLAAAAVRLAREKAPAVVLATNPLFPLTGQASRLSWIGLRPEDFDLVTSYESDSYCKPNPAYYDAICRRIGAKPQECLMIGNDETEDMHAASAIGMQCYLVTDCRISSQGHPWSGPQGSFQEMLAYLAAL